MDEQSLIDRDAALLGEVKSFLDEYKRRDYKLFEMRSPYDSASEPSFARGRAPNSYRFHKMDKQSLIDRWFKFAEKIDPQASTKLLSVPRRIRIEPRPELTSCSLTEPSFARGRAYLELIKLPVGATITRGIVIVRDRNAPHNSFSVVMEGDKGIAEEEAICRICFSKLEDAALKSNCQCGELLTHENCVTNGSTTNGNNKCHYCWEDANNIPVTLLRCLESAQPTNGNGSTNRAQPTNGRESTKSRRLWRLCF